MSTNPHPRRGPYREDRGVNSMTRALLAALVLAVAAVATWWAWLG
ncbi:hypothetical protein [Micromonospora purpureochromogenes]|nr:hypothetical protein [Micromonospora purpureochromogenes]